MTRKLVGFMVVCLTGMMVQAASLKEGTQEFRMDGFFDPSTASGSDFQLGVTYGYFIQDNVEVGGRVAFRNNDDANLFNLGPFAELNVDLGNELVPFVGASLEYASGDTGEESNDAAVITGYGGAKYFLAENVALSAKLALSWATDDVYANDNKAENTDLRVEFGMSFYLPN